MIPALLIASGLAMVGYKLYASRSEPKPEVLPGGDPNTWGPPRPALQTALFGVGDRVIFTSWDSGKQMPATVMAVSASAAGFAKYTIRLDESGRALTDVSQTNLHKAP